MQPDQRIDAAPGRLAVLLGNTRAMWDAFLAACRADARLLQAEHPLDAYVEQRVRAAAGSLGSAPVPNPALCRPLAQGLWPPGRRWRPGALTGPGTSCCQG